MYHADLLGGLANLFAGRYPLLWGIHHTATDRTALNPRTYKILRLNALLSRWLPNRIICCAESARDSHIALGYPAGKMQVIPNGIDSQRFQPQAHARASLRKELALPPGVSLVGLCARFHPAKDHQTFIEAAAMVSKKNPETHFVLCGWQVEWNNPRLSMWIDQAGLRSRCHLLGMRDDMPRILSALDVLVSSSVSEAFPLIVGEAMACGVACVVTNVGDSALLVGNTGQVVPAGDPNSLGEAILFLQGETAVKKGALARKRIMTLYNLEAAVARYIQAYEEIRHANGVT
jgi:glycosyltransferase involved in cell wall biosynthesis